MPRAGSVTFTDPKDYRASIPGAKVDLVFAGVGRFRARVTSLELRHVNLCSVDEWLPRIAFVTLAPDMIFASFATRSGSRRRWCGIDLHWDDIVFHARGERFHERSGEDHHWGLLGLSPVRLAAYARALMACDIAAPCLGRVLRPPSSAMARLRLVRSMACRLIARRPETIAHPQALRALEHDIFHAVIECLTTGDAAGRPDARGDCGDVMARFEDLLAAQPGARWRLPELSPALGVPQRTLRNYCEEVLGLSPGRYARLRQLNLAREALRHADPATARIEPIAQRYGFSELGRFAAAYRTAFGEAPSTTLRGVRPRRMVDAWFRKVNTGVS